MKEKVIITRSSQEIVIQFTKDYYPAGLTSQITWQNPDVIKGLNKMFDINKDEILTGIEINNEGITARLTRVKS